ncbi:hypothetical protein MMC25_006408 [Agyrium rufum]|nr:hypothetical protein [Agyrium rufum]
MGMTMGSFFAFLYTQWFITPPVPRKQLKGQTVIVTGANVGLGLEAARHIARNKASKVIIAVRTVSKGEEAKKDIEATTSCGPGVVEVWPLDLTKYDSVKAFAERAQKLERLDAVIENAGIVGGGPFTMAEQDEMVITTNVVCTFLLALMLLPKMRETAAKFRTLPRLAIVSSEVHMWTDIPERVNPRLFEALSDKKKAAMKERYQVSKLLEVFYVRELVQHTKKDVVINLINPGLCHTSLNRSGGMGFEVMKYLLGARSAEEGGRTLVAGIEAGEETHGEYMNVSKVDKCGPFVYSDEGIKTQKRVYEELNEKLERILPGVTSVI